MRKSLSILGVLLLALVFTGCGEEKKKDKSKIRVDRRGRGTVPGGTSGGGAGKQFSVTPPSNAPAQFRQSVERFNGNAPWGQIVEEFLSAAQPQQLENDVRQIKLRMVGTDLYVEVWDDRAQAENAPFLGGFAYASSEFHIDGFQCFDYTEQYGLVGLCGEFSGNTFNAMVYYLNDNGDQGILGTVSVNRCNIDGTCN